MTNESGSTSGIYEGSVRNRLESLFLASGGHVSRAVEHRHKIEYLLKTGSLHDLQEYFTGPAFVSDRVVRDHEMRYAAMTAVIGILFSDIRRREELLEALRHSAPQIAMTRSFVSQRKYISSNDNFAIELARIASLQQEKIDVLMQVLTHTSEASIDTRGKNKDITRAFENILYGGLSTMDAVLSHMHACIVAGIDAIEPRFKSKEMSISDKHNLVKTIMTVSLHRMQAVAGMRHDLSTKLLNTDDADAKEWELRRRSDGQIVVTTAVLERFLEGGGGTLSRLKVRHQQGDERLKYTQGCPVMILPLFLHAGRAMIERYASKLA